ncbi:hypothetical protein ACH5AJ_36660 [Streptomyces rochei]|uniref:hypothetical protein n=1 Tax=Streptomyces rochei TaxID=1928 RepID=UPI0037AB7FE9
MSPAQLAAEQVVLGHLAASLPTLTDAELDAVAAEHAVAQGHYATAARRLLDAELDRRHPVAADPTPDPDLPPVRPLGPDYTDPTGLRFDRADLADTTPASVPAGVDGWTLTGRTAPPPTLANLGLADDPVAAVVSLRKQIEELTAEADALIAGMTAQELRDLAQYDRPTHLRAVA